MYLMYVDESGDTGIVNSPTQYFILSGIIVHELNWRKTLDDLVVFRKHLFQTKGLRINDEIHCKSFINKPGDLKKIKRNDRVDIIKKCMYWLNTRTDLSVISIVLNKQGKQNNIFELAWNALLLQFENAIKLNYLNGNRNKEDKGIVICDNTDGEKLTWLIRLMRHYNYKPTDEKIKYIIEDPVLRDSKDTLMLQMNDVVAYCVRQKYEPNNYMNKKSGFNLYKKIEYVALKIPNNVNEYGLLEL